MGGGVADDRFVGSVAVLLAVGGGQLGDEQARTSGGACWRFFVLPGKPGDGVAPVGIDEGVMGRSRGTGA